MKLCKDCKWSKNSWLSPFSWEFAKCKSPKQPMEKNIINGKEIQKYTYCVTYRTGAIDCGVEATWFEPK